MNRLDAIRAAFQNLEGRLRAMRWASIDAGLEAVGLWACRH